MLEVRNLTALRTSRSSWCKGSQSWSPQGTRTNGAHLAEFSAGFDLKR